MIVANQQQVVLPKSKSTESKVIPLNVAETFSGISILIPIYNYSAGKLVNTLLEYYLDDSPNIEIICCDDGSSEFTEENKQIEKLPHCTYFRSKNNKGRSQTVNFLAQKASKEYLLILDCDVLPKNVSFLQRYFDATKTGNDVIFGGWEYMPTVSKSQNLRWLFGIYREALSIEKRLKDPYATTFTSNILIKRKLFNTIKFETSLTQYGYEDYLFIKTLQKKGISVHHIENEIYHLNEDYSTEYLQKTKLAIDNLIYLHNAHFLELKESKMGTLYHKLKKGGFTFFVDKCFLLLRKPMEKKLYSYKPSLLIFDIYKAGYFCHQMNKSKKDKK